MTGEAVPPPPPLTACHCPIITCPFLNQVGLFCDLFSSAQNHGWNWRCVWGIKCKQTLTSCSLKACSFTPISTRVQAANMISYVLLKITNHMRQTLITSCGLLMASFACVKLFYINCYSPLTVPSLKRNMPTPNVHWCASSSSLRDTSICPERLQRTRCAAVIQNG